MTLKQLAQKIYVVAASLCLVLAFAHWFHGSEKVDPLLAAQNSRIRFQTGGETSAKQTGLNDVEVSLAESVLAKNRVPDGKHTQLLYVGNSQTIAIMDQAPGDLISPQWLQVLLARENEAGSKNRGEVKPIEVNLGSLPNITAPELLVQLVAAGERSPRQADILVCAVVLEEFRGLGVRDEVARLAATPEVKTRIQSLLDQSHDLPTVQTSLQSLSNSGVSGSNRSTPDAANSSYAQKVEKRLQQSIDRVPLFAARDDLRVQVSLGYHEWRNRLLGITTASVRPVPESSYRASLEMLDLALRYAHSARIKVVLYLAPIRPIQPNPNLPSDVARFRRDVPELCRRYGVKCLDYLDLVPEALWTNYADDATGTQGQRDFAHFTGAAHKLLAEQLMSDAGAQLGLAEHEGNISRR